MTAASAPTPTRPVRIAVCCALQDAGEATRAVALATALRETAPPGLDLELVVLSHGSRFEPMVADAGLRIHRCDPPMEGRSVVDDLGWDPPEITGSLDLAERLIRGERDALAEIRPDLVLHGFWPFASIAARSLAIPSVAFLPLPLHPTSVAHGLMDDLPDEAPAVLTELPRSARRLLIRALSPLVQGLVPAFAQRTIPEAAVRAGWNGPPLRTVFDLLEADLTIVNDLPAFYSATRLAPSFRITGPVMAPGDDMDTAPLEVIDLLVSHDPRPAVLLTMGSSGTQDMFLEALRAVADPRWRAVVLASPAVCPLDVARSAVPEHPGLVITDAFVPAPAVTRAVDLVVCHGGQGTVQTSLAAGVPLVGVGMQVEQQINLQHVERLRAGVRVPRRHWRRDAIRRRMHEVLDDEGCTHAAEQAAAMIARNDGAAEAARVIWQHLGEEPRAR